MGETEPTPAEWKVLRIVTDRAPCAARDVLEQTEVAFGWSTSTVKTLLRRLVEKRLLTATRVGNSFSYRPTRSAKGALLRAADALLDNTTDDAVGPLLMHMVRRSRLSPEEIEELRQLLAKRKEVK